MHCGCQTKLQTDFKWWCIGHVSWYAAKLGFLFTALRHLTVQPFCTHRRFDVHLKNDLLRLVFALACQARQLPDCREGVASCLSSRLHLTSALLLGLGPNNTAVATQFMLKIVTQNCRPKLSPPPMAQKALVATAENNGTTMLILENNRRCIAH